MPGPEQYGGTLAASWDGEASRRTGCFNPVSSDVGEGFVSRQAATWRCCAGKVSRFCCSSAVRRSAAGAGDSGSGYTRLPAHESEIRMAFTFNAWSRWQV
jgi:hypothetical protein